MRYLTILLFFMFVFFSVFMVSIPQKVYSQDTVDCTFCWQPVPRGTNHYDECPVIQKEKQEQARKEQEQDVAISNERAERKRFENKYDADKEGSGNAVEDTIDDELEKEAKLLKRIIKVIANQKGSVKCQGCQNWVDTEKEHWGTGGCAIGHKHWTCKEEERWAHEGCYWVDEPDTNPDAKYENAKYSVTCESCGEVRWTNDFGTYMDWQNNTYCSDCRYKYGY